MFFFSTLYIISHRWRGFYLSISKRNDRAGKYTVSRENCKTIEKRVDLSRVAAIIFGTLYRNGIKPGVEAVEYEWRIEMGVRIRPAGLGRVRCVHRCDRFGEKREAT